jgi:hypothetical protein
MTVHRMTSNMLLLPGCVLLLLAFGASSAEPPVTSDSTLATPADSSCSESPPQAPEALKIPTRPDTAISGSEFAKMTQGWPGRKRQEAALIELRSGNLPQFLRHLKPVHLEYKTREGKTIRAIIWVMPDYMAIGTDEDFLRIPLTRPTAVTIAEEFGFVLPTRKIVDAIADQADFRFKPQPLPPGKMMRSSEYYVKHNEMIEEQHRGRPLGELVAGHKKDLVLTNRLSGRDRIAIYGWHKKDGNPIQPLSTVHAARYADYSHGLRLVYAKACVNGEWRSIYEVLEDASLAPVLSYEGLLARIRKLMHW